MDKMGPEKNGPPGEAVRKQQVGAHLKLTKQVMAAGWIGIKFFCQVSEYRVSEVSEVREDKGFRDS
uniref:Uncharacterized protein n=1 Tax=Arundo donax TaxID=35708 RepID=A0A0A9F9Q2_ARUDO